jgi:hypothetical protein
VSRSNRKLRKIAELEIVRIPADLSPYLVGLYERVALELRISVDYVYRVALGEQESKRVEKALENEMRRISKEARDRITVRLKRRTRDRRQRK